MRIVIAGAGGVGFHLAELLSYESFDIVVIDLDDEVLTHASTHLDVLAIKGDCASPRILNQASVSESDLFISVTTSEKVNILSAALAKKMGAKRTIARVNNSEYMSKEQVELFENMGIDKLISPIALATMEIERLLERCSLTDTFDFENGKISLIGITLDGESSFVNRKVIDIINAHSNLTFKFIAILRGHRTLIPDGQTTIRRGDHIYLFTKKEYIDDLTKAVGKENQAINKVMIIGGGLMGLEVAKKLENKYHITLIEDSKQKCERLVEELHNTLIIKGNPSNIDILKEEGLKEMDAFIAVTPNTETNILTCLMAEKQCETIKTISMIENTEFTHISQNIGVDTIINQKLIAANNIFRFLRKGKIEAITSIHGVDAEVIEFVVQEGIATRKPIKKLNFPAKSLIGGVIRDDKTYIPGGDFQLRANDKIIVFTLPQALKKVEAILN